MGKCNAPQEPCRALHAGDDGFGYPVSSCLSAAVLVAFLWLCGHPASAVTVPATLCDVTGCHTLVDLAAENLDPDIYDGSKYMTGKTTLVAEPPVTPSNHIPRCWSYPSHARPGLPKCGIPVAWSWPQAWDWWDGYSLTDTDSTTRIVRVIDTPKPVPLPASGWLVIAAVGAIGAIRRWRNA